LQNQFGSFDTREKAAPEDPVQGRRHLVKNRFVGVGAPGRGWFGIFSVYLHFRMESQI